MGESIKKDTMNTFPKLALIAAVVAANEIEEEENLHNHFVARRITRAYKFGTGWCGHAGAYTQYADLNGDGRADQTCSDHQGRHWHRMAYGNASFAGTVYSSQIAGWCNGPTAWTRFADLSGDNIGPCTERVVTGSKHTPNTTQRDGADMPVLTLNTLTSTVMARST